VRPVPPSLEDVFVTLTRKGGRAERRPPGGCRANCAGRAGRGRAPYAPQEVESARAVARVQREPVRGLGAMLRKEFCHLRRERSTLFFILLIPVVQLLIFGYAIQTQIEHIPPSSTIWTAGRPAGTSSSRS